MLSARHFKKQNKKTPVSSRPTKYSANNTLLSPLQQRIHVQLTSSNLVEPVLDQSSVVSKPILTPSTKMQASQEAFDMQIKSCADASERREIINAMQIALTDCIGFMPLNSAIEESQKTIDFIIQYRPAQLITYPWIATAPYAKALSVSIACELTEFFNDVCWAFFHVLYKNNKPQCNRVLQQILIATLQYSAAHLDLTIAYFELLDDESPAIPHNQLEAQIESSVKKTTAKIHDFQEQIAHCPLHEGRLLFDLERLLFIAFASHATLEIRRHNLDSATILLEKSSAFIQKHQHTEQYKKSPAPHPKQLFTQLKSSIRAKEKAAKSLFESMAESTAESVQENKPKKKPKPKIQPENKPDVKTENNLEKKITLCHKQKEAERKRLKKREKETSEASLLPKCYATNQHLKHLLDHIYEIFEAFPREGYLFGSANYKQNPGDFDILLPNIKTDADKEQVTQLIQAFEVQGGVAIRNNITGELGYQTGGRYVIPVTWKHWKIDFLISEHDFIQHAKTLDFTIGAMYFSLQDKKMFYMKNFPPFADLNEKRIHTISDPYASFKNDPSLIFRGIRLYATENFSFSSECIHAINTIFFKENNNVFMQLKRGKLYQQLNLVLTSDCEQAMWNTFFNLKLFYKLWDCLLTLPTGSGTQYISRLQNYLGTRPPEIPPSYQPGFFMAPPLCQTQNNNAHTTALNTSPSV